MKLSPVHRRFLLAAACICGLSSTAVGAALGDEPLPALIGELQQMSVEQRAETLRGFGEEFRRAPAPEREQQRRWLKQQWAELSPEQRDQLRSQVREHWLRLSPEQRQHILDVRQDGPSAYGGSGWREGEHLQHLSPDERQEFHQWMREHKNKGRRGGRGGEDKVRGDARQPSP